MVIVSPSIMAADLMNLGNEVRAVENAGADWLHIDIMDGHFVPNVTFGPETVRQIKKITNIPLDVHLMVKNAEQFIEMYASAGADFITIHPESTFHIHRCITRIKELGCKAGIALNPGTNFEMIYSMAQLLDIVLVMSVNPGFYGQEFIDFSLSKIANIKKIKEKESLPFLISVDGGINKLNAEKAVNAGADVLVAGNSVFKQEDYSNAIACLKRTVFSS